MSEEFTPVIFEEVTEFTVPEYDGRPALKLRFSNIRQALDRMHETDIVNGGTYSEIEKIYNMADNEARTGRSRMAHEITKANATKRRIKSELILDEWPSFRKAKGLSENACNRDAYLETNAEYLAIQDRIDMLVAIEQYFDDKIKTFTDVKRTMKKSIDIQLRSVFGDKFTS